MPRLPDSRTGRSVNDFATPDALRKALLSQRTEPSALEPGFALDDFSDQVPITEDTTIDAIGMSFLSVDGQEFLVDKNAAEAQQVSEPELRRLAVLESYRVVGAGRDVSYERLISLLCRIFNAPKAFISVIDMKAQHLLASRGLGGTKEIPREDTICAQVIFSALEIIVIPDLSKNPRFKDRAQAKSDPKVRFYASAPLVCSEGYRLGSVCIMDTIPRPNGLSLEEKQNLREIADMVMDIMTENRDMKNHEFLQPSQLIACTANDILIPLMGVISGLKKVKEDKELQKVLSSQVKEVLNTASTCSSIMRRICKISLDSFNKEKTALTETVNSNVGEDKGNLLNIRNLTKNLHMVMETFPKQVPLIFTIDSAVPPIVVVDDLKVFRCAVNYLTNACTKTERGSVSLKVYLKDEPADGGKTQSIIFSVEDSGPEISVDQYQHLFKPIAGESSSYDVACVNPITDLGTTSSAAILQHTGLGLYSVATQIGSIGGKYGFRPREFTESGRQRSDADGKPLMGSEFWFSIPLVLPSDSKEDKVAPPVSVEQISGDLDEAGGATEDDVLVNNKKRGHEEIAMNYLDERRKRALLIEDSLVDRKVISRLLASKGFIVVEAVNGLEGLHMLQATVFDLVLCDFLMPVMDGIECVEQYREYEIQHRPWFDQFIIGVSGHATEKDVERGLKVGMNDYREKPFTSDVLDEIMECPEFQYASSRLDEIAQDMEFEFPSDAKRSKEDDEEDEEEELSNHRIPICLVAEEGNIVSNLAEKAAEQKGWKVVIIHDGQAALKLLQMRNWDAVLLDDELPGLNSSRCMKQFRKWEQKNRVNKQKAVFQMSSSFIPSHLEKLSSMQLPDGFDGALGKPLALKTLHSFLETAVSSSSNSIVSR